MAGFKCILVSSEVKLNEKLMNECQRQQHSIQKVVTLPFNHFFQLYTYNHIVSQARNTIKYIFIVYHILLWTHLYSFDILSSLCYMFCNYVYVLLLSEPGHCCKKIFLSLPGTSWLLLWWRGSCFRMNELDLHPVVSNSENKQIRLEMSFCGVKKLNN